MAHTEDDDLYDRAPMRFNAALRRLVRTPAPDLAAFSAKPVPSSAKGSTSPSTRTSPH